MFTWSGDGAVVMSNGEQGGKNIGEIVRSIAKACGLPDYGSIKRPSIEITLAKAKQLAGVYKVPNPRAFSILERACGRAVSLKEGVSEPLYAMSANRYFILSQDMVFTIDVSGALVAGRLISDRST